MEQLVSDETRCTSINCFAEGDSAVLDSDIEKTSDAGRILGPGSRWHSMHHCINSVAFRHISGMVSTRPWQEMHPTPFLIWMLWSKFTKSGKSCTRVHSIDSPVRKLLRTGSSFGLSAQI